MIRDEFRSIMDSMKGIIFNLLEDVVSEHHGPDVWDDLLARADVAGAYTSLGNYADDEIFALVGAASERLRLPPADVLRWFGRNALLIMAKRMPEFFDAHSSSRAFILNVNRVIHPEVRKLYAGADCPYFQFKDAEDGAVTMAYRSSRRMCHLAEGFIAAAADHYQDGVEARQDKCFHHGDDHCLFVLKWPQTAQSA